MKHETPRSIEEKMEKRAGLFVLITVIAIVIILVVVGKERGVFKKRYDLKTTFKHGGNIAKNTAVTLAGIKAGEVSDIYINDNHEIEVVMSIQRKFQEMIREDSVAILVSSFLTGSVIDINMGSPKAGVLGNGSRITSAETTEIADKIGVKVLIPESGAIREMLNDIPALLAKVDKLVNNLEEFSRRLNESNIVEHSKTLISNAGEMTSDMKNASEYIPALLAKTDTLLVEFNAVMKDLKIVSEHLKETAPELPRLINSAEGFIENVSEVMDASRKIFFLKKHFKPVGEPIMIMEERRDAF